GDGGRRRGARRLRALRGRARRRRGCCRGRGRPRGRRRGRRRGRDGHVHEHGPGGRARGAPGRARALPGERAAAAGRRPRARRPALPAGALRRGDHAGRALGRELGGVGRGGEPAARPEGAAGHDRLTRRKDGTVAEKIVLAYSGGLDTSVALRWLAEEYGAEVVALLVDVGQGVDREAVTRRAMAAGAADVVIADAREEFAREFVLPVLQAGALYEGRYPLVSALSRPLIARHLVAVAREAGATAVAHGCTGKGNDQVRFETAVAARAPDLAVLAPVRDWGMTREQEIAYAERHGIEVPVKRGAAYSIDQNLWGRSIEAGPLEDPWVAPPEEAYALTLSPERAFHASQEVEIQFEAGVPVAVDGEELGLVELIARAAALAG